MAKSQSDSYKKAGVDIEAGYKSVQMIKSSVAKTYSKNVTTLENTTTSGKKIS